jgi:hypothetical protein
MCKSLFYKIIARLTISSPSSNAQLIEKDQTLLIFSEGKTYWSTFHPIINELIKQKKHFRYITLDVHDPALCIDSKFMHSKLYYRTQLSFAQLAKIKAPVMLATTTNIGSPGYPMKRPLQVGSLVHIFHAMSNISNYKMGSLDYYDVVLMIGDHEKTPIRTVESARQTKKKELVTCGLPYLDDLYKQKQEAEKIEAAPSKVNTTILVAPSWGSKGCFSEYGIDFVENLSQAGFSIIIRLHPHSYNFDSDTSSIRFDFAFLYNKPVITLDIPKESREEFEAIYLDQPWAEMVSSQIGSVVTHKSIDRLTEIVKSTLKDFSRQKLQDLRDTTIANFGNSAPKIVTYLFEKIDEKSLPSEL